MEMTGAQCDCEVQSYDILVMPAELFLNFYEPQTIPSKILIHVKVKIWELYDIDAGTSDLRRYLIMNRHYDRLQVRTYLAMCRIRRFLLL